MTEKKEHYSSARGRLLRDDDYISLTEVCEILVQNRGENISRDTVVSRMIRSGVRRAHELYRYEDVRDMVVPHMRGRRALDNPSPGAIRAREFRERQRARARVGGGVPGGDTAE